MVMVSPSPTRSAPRMMLLSPMKRATSSVAGLVAIVSGSAICWIRAVVHDDDPVGHRERLFLVVRDVDEHQPELALEVAQLDAHAQLEQAVEVAERLVEQERLRACVTSTRASATRCCWPPESARGLRSASSVEADHLERLDRRLLGARPCRRPRIFSPNATLSSTERCGKSAKCWKTVVVGRLCGGRSTSDWPSRTMSPSVGNSWPPIIRSVVVLPQPDGPSSDDVLAVVDVQVDVVDGGDVAGEDAVDVLENRGPSRRRSRER